VDLDGINPHSIGTYAFCTASSVFLLIYTNDGIFPNYKSDKRPTNHSFRKKMKKGRKGLK
jgi:hypothetical protein